MAIFDLFSKRKARKEGSVIPLQSDQLPPKFRGQVFHILVDGLGCWVEPSFYMDARDIHSNRSWIEINSILLRESGLTSLSKGENPFQDCYRYFVTSKAEEALDFLEIALRFIRFVGRHSNGEIRPYDGTQLCANEAISDFNTRCRENGVGYEFVEDQIIPVSSSFVHSQVVEPALTLLHRQGFEGARDEFMQSFGHLRRGDTKSAIVEALKAFESTMKAICVQKQWAYDAGKATAKDLIAILLEKGLIPASLQTQFANFRSLLESGVPTVRNKNGGHGQGPEPVEVPRALAEYAIHLTATNIVFLVGLAK